MKDGADMWKFISYCFWCICVVVSAAFGNNPSGLTWQHGIIGVISLIVLGLIVFGIIWVIAYTNVQISKAKRAKEISQK